MKKITLLTGLLAAIACYSQKSESVFIHFALDKYELTPAARATLDSLTDSLDLADRIELHGHTDASGTNEYNRQLSFRRVEAVEKYLLSNGWEKKDITVMKAHGENIPLNDNATANDRSLNRRVEIRILRGQAVPSLKQQLGDSTLKTGTNITLRNIQFEGGTRHFLKTSYPALEELLEAMKTHPKLVIRVEGHICCQPDNGDGPDLETGINNLSEMRAKAVMDYLVENGIEPKRISYKGMGHSMPVYLFPEKTEEEMIANRRVEIKIISK